MHNDPQEYREPRPEPLRILLYILLTGCVVLLGMLLNAAVTERLMESPSEGLSLGERMAIYSYCIAYLQPLLIMLLNRCLTFRSDRALLSSVLWMLACTAVVNMAQSLLTMVVARMLGAEVLSRLPMILLVVEQVIYYLFQRYFLFRDSLDAR